MRVKSGLAEMLKGGVIMDVVNADQARIAEEAGAVAVMALERVPADIRVEGGVARMSDPGMIREIQEAVSIPVMAKCRIGHFAEAQILQALEIDYIDESEVLTPADLEHHVDKWAFTVPFVCGATNLGEALRRIAEGAAMIRTKGEAGTGDIVNAVTHMRSVFGGIRRLGSLRSEELYAEAKELRAPLELVQWVAEHGRLPVVTFTAGGIATPADAALCMQLGADGVFVGSGIFKSGDPAKRARAIVEATTHYMDADVLARVSEGLGEPMVGISTARLDPERAARDARLVGRRLEIRDAAPGRTGGAWTDPRRGVLAARRLPRPGRVPGVLRRARERRLADGEARRERPRRRQRRGGARRRRPLRRPARVRRARGDHLDPRRVGAPAPRCGSRARASASAGPHDGLHRAGAGRPATLRSSCTRRASCRPPGGSTSSSASSARPTSTSSTRAGRRCSGSGSGWLSRAA